LNENFIIERRARQIIDLHLAAMKQFVFESVHDATPHPSHTPTRTPMKVVAFLQCLWVNEPKRVKSMLEQAERDRPANGRERMLARLLFYGGKTGKVLTAGLGEKWCDRIVWEESTREIGDYSGAAFPPDVSHIHAVLEKHKPTVVIAMGAVARDALQKIHGTMPCPKAWHFIAGPHPVARSGPNPREWLESIAKHLDSLDSLQ
jgi:hypothetical protein